jgi:hypothetical protein
LLNKIQRAGFFQPRRRGWPQATAVNNENEYCLQSGMDFCPWSCTCTVASTRMAAGHRSQQRKRILSAKWNGHLFMKLHMYRRVDKDGRRPPQSTYCQRDAGPRGYHSVVDSRKGPAALHHQRDGFRFQSQTSITFGRDAQLLLSRSCLMRSFIFWYRARSRGVSQSSSRRAGTEIELPSTILTRTR